MNLVMNHGMLSETLGDEKAFTMMKKAGFDGLDLSLYSAPKGVESRLDETYLEQAKATKRLLGEHGLICNQAHAPFDIFMCDMKMDCSEPTFLATVRSMEYAAVVGAKHIVIHGIKVPSRAGSLESMEYNYKFYKALEPYAKQFGIRIAIENIYHCFDRPFDLNEILRRLDDSCFLACVDLGHSHLFGVYPELWLADMAPGTVQALHVNDNFGPVRNPTWKADYHLIPGFGSVDWDNVIKALREIKYAGDFTLELSTRALDERDLQAMLDLAASVGRTMIAKIEKNS